MTSTDKFRQQHNELLNLANELQELLDENILVEDGTAARRCLGSFMGRLQMHLAMEDKVLYPELEAHKNPEVATLARRFSAEMKTMPINVVAYNVRWATPSAIKADACGFIEETRAVIKFLTDRIRRENQELYAMADRSEESA